jgi:predicted helicase
LISVCIIFLVKNKTESKNKTVHYFSTKENGLISREQKLAFLEKAQFSKVDWKKLLPQETINYWFVTKDLSEKQIFISFIIIVNIFSKYSSGLEAGKDSFCIKYTNEELVLLKEEVSKKSIEEIRRQYNVDDSANWTLNSSY